jgi:UDP:flavonoid glycosyltransferase YjiC (YdhE family)
VARSPYAVKPRVPGRFLIASWDGGGNTPAAYNLGARLLGRGHRVRLLGWPAMAGPAQRAGLDFATYPTTPTFPEGIAHEDDWPLLTECLWGTACQADIADAARDFVADVLVLDCFMRAGFEAARDLDRPTAALVHVSYERFVHGWGPQALETDTAALLARCAAVLALQPPGLDEPCLLPVGTEYVGPVLPPGPRALDHETSRLVQSRGDPWVLLSVSTTHQHGQREVLSGVLRALADEPVRVLLTVANGLDLPSLDGPANVVPANVVPANVVVTGQLPHDLLLPHMAAFVTHAGMSGVTFSLAAGVPVVCIPQGRDQGDNARRVAAVGAGLVTDIDGVAPAVKSVLTEPAFRATARTFADRCRPLGSGERATDLVEALRSGRAVTG